MSEWIDVKKQLPNHEDSCDIYTKAGQRLTDVLYTNYSDSEPHFFHEDSDSILHIEDVTHWMPLPEDPKG